MELRWKCYADHKYYVTVKRSHILDKLIDKLTVGEETYERIVTHKPVLQYKEDGEWIDVPVEMFPFPNPEDFPDTVEER